MHHLFCISSPFQADSARRIINHFKLPLNSVCILLFDHAFERDFERVQCSLGDLANQVDIRPIRYKTNSLSRRLSFIRKEAPTGAFTVYCGDWRSKLFKFFALHPKFKGFVSIDDGTASFITAQHAEMSAKKLYAFIPRLKPTIISRYPIEKLFPSLNVIPLPPQHQSLPLDDNTVLFIGCCVVEKGIMTEEDYQETLEQAKAAFPDRQWLYYSHRSELDRVLPQGFNRIPATLPIEHWFSTLARPPRTLVSLFSSALFNLVSDYPDTKAFYLKPEDSRFLTRTKDINVVYEWLARLPEFTCIKNRK